MFQEKNLAAVMRIDIALWEKYRGKSDIYPTQSQAISFLEADLETLALNGDATMEQLASDIREMPDGIEVLSYLDVGRIEACVNIRKDWAAALRGVKTGRQLSGKIGYGFAKTDISQLAKLHKSGRFRKKIEDLLEDCNFHSECSKFARGAYDKITPPQAHGFNRG